MMARIVLAALVGALCGMLAATSGLIWPPLSGVQTLDTAKTLAQVEAALRAVRQHRSP
jgi:hypothetical protein